MKKLLSNRGVSRRRVLMAGMGAAGAAAAVGMPLAREGEPTQRAAQPGTQPSGGGYRLTEHVQRYYRSTRV